MGFMNLLKIGSRVKPMFRDLGNGRVLEYTNFGNGVTKSRILLNNQEIFNRTSAVNREIGERLISETSRLPINFNEQFATKYFKHIKINNIYNEAGNLLKRNKLIEQGVANPASKGGYCRTSDFSLISQKPNELISEIKCTQPNFEYTRNLDTSPTIFNWT